MKLRPEGFFRPVEYAARTRYRRPPGFYRRLQSVAPVFSALGLTPNYVVRLEVPGRRTGVIRSSFMVLVGSGGQRYVVALAGESEWVRNVRAAHGHVVLRDHRQRYAARLAEVPASERAEVIRAYVHRPSPRGRPMIRTGEARHYFGIEPDATPARSQQWLRTTRSSASTGSGGHRQPTVVPGRLPDETGDKRGTTMKILVAYATRHGATAGVAERIAATLAASGRPAEARPVEKVTTVRGYDAVASWVARHTCSTDSNQR